VITIITGPAPTAEVEACNRPDAGVTTFDAPVNATQFQAVTHSMFEALGQTSAATGNKVRATKHQVPLLTVSLLCRPIRTVVVDNVQRCGTASLTHLIHTALSAHTDLVLIPRGNRPSAFDRVLDAWPHRHRTWPTTRRELTARRPSDDLEPAPGSGFPTVPNTEFPMFLAECRRTLDAADIAVVDAEYRRILRSVRDEVHSDPTGSGVLESLRRHMYDATTADHAVTIVRAGTAAVFPIGLFVTCPANQLRATVRAEPYFGARSHVDWSALHTYRRPERAAVAVLAAAGIHAAAMCELTVSDAAEAELRLPPPARPHLRRVVLLRTISGAVDSDPLLTLADGRPMTTRWVRETILDIGRTTNLPADRRRRRPQRQTEFQWAAALGIRVRSL
jgi:hypothetical protein